MQKTGKVARGCVLPLLVGALALLTAAQAHAGALEAAKARGTLVVGVRKDFPPLGYLDDNGKSAGFEIDLARYMARQLLGDEEKLRVTPVSAGNRITALISGSVDLLIAAVTVMEDRATVLAFSEPYFLSGTLLLVPRNSSIQGLPDVKGKRVAVIEGSIQEGGIAPVYPEAIRVKFWTVSEAVAALQAGRVDAFAVDFLQNRLRIGHIREARNAAQLRAASERDHHLRLGFRSG